MRGLQFPWDTPAAPAARSPLLDPPTPKAMGRRPASATLNAVLGMAPNWLFHHLTVVGPAEPVAAFAVAARGAGVTPWRLDFAAIEEEVFAQAVAQPASRRNLTVEGCRILARQFRERVERRQARAADLVGHSIACPLDLHALLPVPEAILVLGPTHLPARAWLAAHWGITDRLRQVAARDKPTTGRRLPKGHAVIGYSFFTDGETPHAAITELATRFSPVRFVLQPRPLG